MRLGVVRPTLSFVRKSCFGNGLLLLLDALAFRVPVSWLQARRSIQMQLLMTAISVIGGMAFSLAFAILVE